MRVRCVFVRVWARRSAWYGGSASHKHCVRKLYTSGSLRRIKTMWGVVSEIISGVVRHMLLLLVVVVVVVVEIMRTAMGVVEEC